MMNVIDRLIDHVTMYRLLLYYLVVILCAALLFGAIGVMPYSPYSIVLSVALSVGACLATNYIFAKLYNAPSNWESSILTGLILSLVITPILSPKDIPFILAASGLAIASKYILAIYNKHIFNPVAIAIVLTAFGPQESASWWVGSVWLLPFVVIGGLLIVHKIRRTRMALLFFVVALVSSLLWAIVAGQQPLNTLSATILHSSLFFLGFAMLTEPATSPTTKYRRYIYAAVVGFLFAPSFHIGSLYSTPELALIAGNIVAFALTPIVKTKVRVIATTLFGSRTQDIELVPERTFSYKPGQYIEMTIPHFPADSRGVRRYFTLASSPTEPNLHLGVRYYDPSSSFKTLLRNLEQPLMSFGQLGGDFVMPKDASKKLVFIAGGIGVTPFRSMIKYLSDTNERRDIHLLYAERAQEDISYSSIFEEARQKVGVQTTYLLENQSDIPYSQMGRVSAESITALVPDYKDRLFYLSGPQPMIQSVKQQLRQIGVPTHRIKVDYFPGYA